MGGYLPQPITDKNLVTGSNEQIQYGCALMHSWILWMEESSIHNIDIGDGNSLFAVIDGFAGKYVGQCVSERLVDILKGTIEYQEKNYLGAFATAFRIIDEFLGKPQGIEYLTGLAYKGVVNPHSVDEKNIRSSGCSINAILITSEKFYVANLGNTRSALMRSGQCIKLSQQHIPSMPQQIQRIHHAGGKLFQGRVEGGLHISRCLGSLDYKSKVDFSYDKQTVICKPYLFQLEKSKDDQFILQGTDGLWDRYPNGDCSELMEIVRKQLQYKQVSEVIPDMLDMLLAKSPSEGPGRNNMTALIIKFKK